LIDDETTLSRLTDDVRSRVMDPPPEIAEDIEEFVRDLSSRELIVVEHATAPDD
jgi:hypothetical protein